MEAAAADVVRVGVASHNLFDIAFALVLAEDTGVAVEVEMLAGMADAEARAVAERVGRLLFYVPITSRRDFRNALAYLARRLDENATPEGFLRHSLELVPGGAAWDEQADRFAEALGRRRSVATRPRQHQDRATDRGSLPPADGWHNEPDTDLTVPSNRGWALVCTGPPRPPETAPLRRGPTSSGRWHAPWPPHRPGRRCSRPNGPCCSSGRPRSSPPTGRTQWR